MDTKDETKIVMTKFVLGFCRGQLRFCLLVRISPFSNYDADATELFELLGWKNHARQQEIHKATMMFRCLHRLAPEYLNSKIMWRDSAYDLRDSENKLNVPLPHTYFIKINITEKALPTMVPHYGTVYHVI